jgi:lipoprotein-anchoring transpeptidase ErfK/SrfK
MPPEPTDRARLSADWLQRGRAALRAGQRAEARRALQAAVSADPANAAAWLHLARLSTPRARLVYTTQSASLGYAPARAELRHARQWAAPPAVALPRRAAVPAPVLVLLLVVALLLLGALAALRLALPHASALLAAALGNPPSTAVAQVPPSGQGEVKAGALGPTATRAATRTAPATSTATPTPTATEPPSPTPTAAPSDTPAPAPTGTPAAPGERWIEVDLSDQRVFAHEGEAVVNNFLVSTGLWNTPTVVGEFAIYVKYQAADMWGPGYYLPAVPYVMYFYEDYGLHGTYWHSNFGTPMSHGCVNLRTDDAGWLFNWASVGTRVWVHD